MIYKEFGCKNEKIIIFLHGGGLSWWGYSSVAEKLADKYHVILPVLDGHGDSQRPFVSIEENAQDIIRFIDDNFGGHIFMLGGLSLGGQIALEILSQRKDICQYAVIESALVMPSKLTEILVKPMIDCSYWLISKLWFARIQFDYLKIKSDLFKKYYEDSCKISRNDMISFLKANSSYRINSKLKNTNAKVLVCVGEKEQKSIIKSAKTIAETITGSQLCIVPDLYHGQLSVNCSEKFISMINDFIQ